MDNIDLVGESQRETEKGAKFRGRARVSLDALQFPVRFPRELDRDNVKRLKEIFELNINRLDPQNHIPALIKNSVLEQATQAAGTTVHALLENSMAQLPFLVFSPDVLKCLHGKHRIQAAKESDLPEAERWWVVRFYLDTLSTDTQASLIEDHASSKCFSDGWLYRKVMSTASYERQHWLAWLTDCKVVILKQLFGHTGLSKALQELERIPALLEDLEITQWHKIMATHSDEEFIHYLRRTVMKVWKTIAGDDDINMRDLDADTVRCVQSRCPGSSVEDRDYLWNKMESGHMLASLGIDRKAAVWRALKQIKIPIPTLRTLQQDYKYLNAPSRILRRLLSPPKSEKKRRTRQLLFQDESPARRPPSLRALARKCFRSTGTDSFILQLSNDQFVSLEGNDAMQFETAFQQLYLSIMRRIFDLDGNEKPLKDVGRKAWTVREPDPIEEFCLAQEAFKFGFESQEIARLRAMDPFMEKARRQLADQDVANYDIISLNSILRATADMYQAASNEAKSQTKSEPDMLATDDGPPIQRRSGRQSVKSYEKDRVHMFLTIMHLPPAGSNRTITTLFVRKSVFLAFFPSVNIGRDWATPDDDGLANAPEILVSPELSPSPESTMHSPHIAQDNVEASAINRRDHASSVPDAMLGQGEIEMSPTDHRDSTTSIPNAMPGQGEIEMSTTDHRDSPTWVPGTMLDRDDMGETTVVRPDVSGVSPYVERVEKKRQRVGKGSATTLPEIIDDGQVVEETASSPDKHREADNPSITVFLRPNEGGERQLGTYKSEEELLELIAQQESLHFRPVDDVGRNIAPRECYSFAIRNKHVLILEEEL